MTAQDGGGSLAELVHQWEEQRPDLDLTAFRLVGAIMQMAQVLEGEFRTLAQAQFGIGSGDLRILMALRRSGEPYQLRPTDLFQSLLVSSGAVTKQVDRLTEAGFVKKVVPKGGGRRYLIGLTAKGVRASDLAQEAIATSLAGIAPSFHAMPQADVETTLHTLEQLLEAAKATGAGDEGGDEEEAG